MIDPNPVQRLLGSPSTEGGLDRRVAAIVRANHGQVSYRMLGLLTGWPRANLRASVRRCRAAGMIPPPPTTRRK